MLPSNPICPVCNYATSAVYCDLPSPEQLANGVKPLDSLPAAWWNNMWNMVNCSVNQARGAVGSFITELNNVLAGAGICPNCVCTDQLYQAIDLIRQTIGNATVAGAVKSSTTPGMVSIDANGFMTANCLGNAAQLTTTAHTLVGAVNELKSTYDTCTSGLTTAVNSKAPINHASSANTYGVGTAAAYGHLRISNTYTSDLGDAGMAASQSALYSVYNYATQISAAAIGLGNTVGCPLGTASAGSASTSARSDHVHPSCTNRVFVVDAHDTGNWNEGIRINAACNGAAILMIGGESGSDTGCSQSFLIGKTSSCGQKLFVTSQGSWSDSYFAPTGSADGTVYWHGNVCGHVNGNVYGQAYAGLGNTTWDCTQSWGSNVGITFAGWQDGSGGSVYFQCNNPTNGEMSMVIDGTVYVDEGRYPVIHTGNIGSQSVNAASYAYNIWNYTLGCWMTFQWVGNNGQPSWLWGSNDGVNTQVYDPSNFCVAYATYTSRSNTGIFIDFDKSGCWNEGIRINRATNNWSTLTFGGLRGSMDGCMETFSMHTNPVDYPNKLFLAYQGSSVDSYFEPTGVSGAVKWHGDVNGCACAACSARCAYQIPICSGGQHVDWASIWICR